MAAGSLRNLVLTPERIPGFFVPSRSPFLSPGLRRTSPDRTRLLSDHDDGSPGSSPPADPRSRNLLRLPTPRVRRPRRPDGAESADVDLTTRAAFSLPHVGKGTTPYGFRAVLAASPCTSRRESLFHRNRPAVVTVTDSDPQDSEAPTPPPPPAGPGRSRHCMHPVRALGLQVIRELKRPAVMLKALSPAHRR